MQDGGGTGWEGKEEAISGRKKSKQYRLYKTEEDTPANLLQGDCVCLPRPCLRLGPFLGPLLGPLPLHLLKLLAQCLNYVGAQALIKFKSHHGAPLLQIIQCFPSPVPKNPLLWRRLCAPPSLLPPPPSTLPVSCSLHACWHCLRPPLRALCLTRVFSRAWTTTCRRASLSAAPFFPSGMCAL